MTRKSKLVLVLGTAIGLAWLATGWGAGVQPQAKPTVLVQAFYPFPEGHMYIIKYVKALPAKFPGKVAVQTYDMQEDKGRKLWSKTGLGCAGVFVNGRTRHTIVRANGKRETVDFIKRMDDWWTKKDFEIVLKAELEHPSPLPKAGFITGDDKAGALAYDKSTGKGGGAKAAPAKTSAGKRR